MMMPLYFLLAFFGLQLGQLITGMLVVNYAAGSIARHAVADNISGSRSYPDVMQRLMVAGMKNPSGVANASTELMGDVNVDACVEIGAFPFVSQLASKALSAGSSAACASVQNIAFNSAGTGAFVLKGKALARMNMRP